MDEKKSGLLCFLYALGRVRDDALLHASVYAAQRLGLLESDYEFSFRTNVPHSTELASVLYGFVCEELVVDTKTANSIYVPIEPEGAVHPAVNKMRELGPAALLISARLLRKLQRRAADPSELPEVAAAMVQSDGVPSELVDEAIGFIRGVSAA